MFLLLGQVSGFQRLFFFFFFLHICVSAYMITDVRFINHILFSVTLCLIFLNRQPLLCRPLRGKHKNDSFHTNIISEAINRRKKKSRAVGKHIKKYSQATLWSRMTDEEWKQFLWTTKVIMMWTLFICNLGNSCVNSRSAATGWSLKALSMWEFSGNRTQNNLLSDQR